MIRENNGHVPASIRAANLKYHQRDAEFVERFLAQEYDPVNLEVVRSVCNSFNVNNPLCRSCRFYTQENQKLKHNTTCELWPGVFGPELKRMVIHLAFTGVKIAPKFMQIWHARRILIPSKVPKSASVEHARGPVYRERHGDMAIPIIQMD